MASKQDNYLRMHHPSIFKKMKKGGKVEDYNKGGKVKCYAQGGRNTDTIPAMLTVGETVLNEEQQTALGNMFAGGGKVGGLAKAAALFKHIGVPGYENGGIAEDSQPQLLPGKTKEEYATAFKLDPSTVSVDTLGHTPESYDFRIKGTGLGGKEKSFRDTSKLTDVTIGTGQEQLIAPDWRAQVDSLKSTGKMSDLRKGMALFHEKTKGMTPEEIIAQQYTKKAGGGLVDKKDALMSYYMGGRVKKKKKKQKRGY